MTSSSAVGLTVDMLITLLLLKVESLGEAAESRVRNRCDRVPSLAPSSLATYPSSVRRMERPTRFEHSRYLGDKRTQLVYDLDTWTESAVIDEIVAADIGICFGPDTLAEARNRGYSAARAGQTRRHRKPRT